MGGSYDYVEVRVAPSDKQIETVEMAGSVWMAFNARSSDLEDQIYPLDGATVEDMYRTSWINTVGGLFQCGRKYMYVPWQGYNPSNNLGNQTATCFGRMIRTCLALKDIECYPRRTELLASERPRDSRYLYGGKRRADYRHAPCGRRYVGDSYRCHRNTTLREVYFGRYRPLPHHTFGRRERRQIDLQQSLFRKTCRVVD